MMNKVQLVAVVLLATTSAVLSQEWVDYVAKTKFESIRYDLRQEDWLKAAKPAFFEVKEVNNQAGGNPKESITYKQTVSQSISSSNTDTTGGSLSVTAEFGSCFICPAKTTAGFTHTWGKSTTKSEVYTKSQEFSATTEVTVPEIGRCVQAVGYIEYVEDLKVPFTMYVRLYHRPKVLMPWLQVQIPLPFDEFTRIARSTYGRYFLGTGQDTEGSFVRVALRGIMTFNMGVKASMKTCPCGMSVPACMRYAAPQARAARPG